MSEIKLPFEAADILRLLPHRYPMLMVDRVLEIELGTSIRATKNVSFNEPYFEGHFPGNPVMPGVLILESMAQASALLGFATNPALVESGGVLLMGIDSARFRAPVTPGDVLDISMSVERTRGNIWTLKGGVTVEGTRVANAQIMATFYEGEIRG